MTRVRPATFALADLDRMVDAGWDEVWLLHDRDFGWSWWPRVDGTEDIVAYAAREAVECIQPGSTYPIISCGLRKRSWWKNS